MKNLTIRPYWLKAGTIVIHRPSGVLFEVARLQQTRGQQEVWLLHRRAPDARTETRYPLSECDRASWEDIKVGCVVLKGDETVAITHPERQIQAVVEAEDTTLMLDQVYLAATAIALQEYSVSRFMRHCWKAITWLRRRLKQENQHDDRAMPPGWLMR